MIVDGIVRRLQQKSRGGLDDAGHTGVLHVAAVGFGPAGEGTLVDGVFSPCTRHVVHPDQTGTCTGAQKTHTVGLVHKR